MDKFIRKFASNDFIPKEDKELYIYGLETGIFMLLNIISTLVIGLILGMFFESIIFLAVYSPLRVFAGGIHAKSRRSCYVYSLLLTFSALLLVKFLPNEIIIISFLTVFSATCLYLLAPIEDKNKPLNRQEEASYKFKTRMILVPKIIVLIICALTMQNKIALCIAISLFALSIMLILGKIKNTVIENNSI